MGITINLRAPARKKSSFEFKKNAFNNVPSLAMIHLYKYTGLKITRESESDK